MRLKRNFNFEAYKQPIKGSPKPLQPAEQPIIVPGTNAALIFTQIRLSLNTTGKAYIGPSGREHLIAAVLSLATFLRRSASNWDASLVRRPSMFLIDFCARDFVWTRSLSFDAIDVLRFHLMVTLSHTGLKVRSPSDPVLDAAEDLASPSAASHAAESASPLGPASSARGLSQADEQDLARAQSGDQDSKVPACCKLYGIHVSFADCLVQGKSRAADRGCLSSLPRGVNDRLLQSILLAAEQSVTH